MRIREPSVWPLNDTQRFFFAFRQPSIDRYLIYLLDRDRHFVVFQVQRDSPGADRCGSQSSRGGHISIGVVLEHEHIGSGIVIDGVNLLVDGVEGDSANEIDSRSVAGDHGSRVGYIIAHEISVVCPQTKKILVCHRHDVRLRIDGDVREYGETIPHLTKR